VPQRRFEDLAGSVPEDEIHQVRLGVRVRDVGLMLYTSGTTANPKGCVITHDSVIGPWREAARRLGITGDDRMWDPLPLFHLSCLGPLLFMVDLGGTIVTTTHFDAAEALADIATERISWVYSIFPTITMALVTHPAFGSLDTSRIRGTLNSAPPDTMRVIQRAFPNTPNYGGHFGLTEASGAVTCHRVDAPVSERLETHGAALPGLEVRAADPESGSDVPPGEPGELLVRGRGLMAGYYGDPEATAEAVREGWLHTGDLGTISAEGLVTFRSRLKDMLKVGGENVSPAEIESHLSTHPAVKLAKVVGAPDERLGEVVAAFVEVAPGHTMGEDDVIAHCEGAIASFKVPRHVRFVSDWPMSATKIQKFRLRETIASEIEGAS
jgi:acyl-CoA synthetase (AMP-forming)/AMP-acid ligase II